MLNVIEVSFKLGQEFVILLIRDLRAIFTILEALRQVTVFSSQTFDFSCCGLVAVNILLDL
jgi:hypothetical protein